MKLAPPQKKPVTSVPSGCAPGMLDDDDNLPSANHLGVQGLFFHHLCKVAQIGRKQVAYRLRVSKTLVDQWMSGDKADPLTRARDVCDLFRQQKRGDLVSDILVYVAGGFDGGILTPEQWEGLRTLSKALKEEAQP